jgi:hypothetical protein
MTTRRFALKIRVGEILEILDGLRSQGIATVVSSSGNGDLINYDVECLYYSLENLGERISLHRFSLAELERDYEAIRKNLLGLVTRMAGIVASVTGPQTGVDIYDYAICA